MNNAISWPASKLRPASYNPAFPPLGRVVGKPSKWPIKFS